MPDAAGPASSQTHVMPITGRQGQDDMRARRHGRSDHAPRCTLPARHPPHRHAGGRPVHRRQETPSRGTPSREANRAGPAEESEASGNQPERYAPGRARPARIDKRTAARAAALFASDLSRWASPAEAEAAAAIKHALRVFGGTQGCAGEVAAAFGEHPETAVSRMRWALQAVQLTYAHGRADPHGVDYFGPELSPSELDEFSDSLMTPIHTHRPATSKEVLPCRPQRP